MRIPLLARVADDTSQPVRFFGSERAPRRSERVGRRFSPSPFLSGRLWRARPADGHGGARPRGLGLTFQRRPSVPATLAVISVRLGAAAVATSKFPSHNFPPPTRCSPSCEPSAEPRGVKPARTRRFARASRSRRRRASRARKCGASVAQASLRLAASRRRAAATSANATIVCAAAPRRRAAQRRAALQDLRCRVAAPVLYDHRGREQSTFCERPLMSRRCEFAARRAAAAASCAADMASATASIRRIDTATDSRSAAR